MDAYAQANTDVIENIMAAAIADGQESLLKYWRAGESSRRAATS
jgi:hypothetical protein